MFVSCYHGRPVNAFGESVAHVLVGDGDGVAVFVNGQWELHRSPTAVSNETANKSFTKDTDKRQPKLTATKSNDSNKKIDLLVDAIGLRPSGRNAAEGSLNSASADIHLGSIGESHLIGTLLDPSVIM